MPTKLNLIKIAHKKLTAHELLVYNILVFIEIMLIVEAVTHLDNLPLL